MARIELKREQPREALRRLQIYFDAKLSDAAFEPYELLREILLSLEPSEENSKAELKTKLAALREAAKILRTEELDLLAEDFLALEPRLPPELSRSVTH